MNPLSTFTTPCDRMSGFQIEVGPVVLNPVGGIVDGVEPARWQFGFCCGNRLLGEPGCVNSRTTDDFVLWQRQKHSLAVVEDEFLEALQQELAWSVYTSRVL